MQDHRNNIGVMRLVLACMVIIGHAPELIDGNRSREPLAQIMPEASLGGFAVSGFFLLSGYLIAGSMIRVNAVGPYLERRFMRIVPGYAIAYLLSMLVAAPLLGADIWPKLDEATVNLLFLKAPPNLPGLIAAYPSINGAMWTIAYEFRLYIMIAIFWSLGFLGNKRLFLLITIMSVIATIAIGSYRVVAFINIPASIRWFDLLFGEPSAEVGFIATFLVGASFYLYRDRLSPYVTWRAALGSIFLAYVAFHSKFLAEFARAVLLAIPVFWIALKADLGPIRRINDRWDISYGTYLYGWPISTAILILHRSIAPWALAGATLPPALLAGCASWWLVEKNAQGISMRHRLRPHRLQRRG